MRPRSGSEAIVAAVVLLGIGGVMAVLCPVTSGVVVGPSMEPVLSQGDRVLVDRWSYRHRPPRVGEVALLEGPGGVPMVKRVAASVEGGLRVRGDNAARSLDSREFGSLGTARVRGRVVFRYWPPSRLGPLASRRAAGEGEPAGR